MRMLLPWVFLLPVLLSVGGCQSAEARRREASPEFAALDPATQAAVRRGVVEPGFTPEAVTLTLGRPAQVTTDATGRTVWLYPREPMTAPNETVLSGFVRRVVYNPEKRSNEVTVTPIDEKAFPHLVPHTVRITFADGRVATVERVRR